MKELVNLLWESVRQNFPFADIEKWMVEKYIEQTEDLDESRCFDFCMSRFGDQIVMEGV